MSGRELSPAQIAANKANAQRSTGPRTTEGKARVSENALKHGLRSARNPLDISTQIPGEQTQFEELLADLTASLHPTDPAEAQLVARLAQLTLRLNRAATMETATLDQTRAEALVSANKFPSQFPDPASPAFETAILASTFTRASAQLKLLSQYESRLSLDFARTLRQIQQLQKTHKQTQPALNLKEELPRPQHTGTGSSVPSDTNAASSKDPTQARVDIGACPPTNAQNPDSTQSPPLNFDQTNPSSSQPTDPIGPKQTPPPAPHPNLGPHGIIA